MKGWEGIVLAAGKGERMRSSVPKVLHLVCGVPMIRFVVDAMNIGGLESPLVIVPNQDQIFRDALGESVHYAHQSQVKGTGDAVAIALDNLNDSSQHVLVMNGDVPLVRPETLVQAMKAHLLEDADVTFLTTENSSAQGLGKVERDANGEILRITEALDAEGTLDKVSEVAIGVYCFRVAWIRDGIANIKASRHGEAYITSIVEIAQRQSARVVSYSVHDSSQGLGVNTRMELANVETVMRQRIREHWILQGVHMMDPSTVYIDYQVAIGRDTMLYPNTLLLGNTAIGERCEIGPNTVIRNSGIGDQCTVSASFMEKTILERSVTVGPFSNLRPETYVEQGVHIGNFVEIKKTRLSQGVKIGHFSYIGDAFIGANVNVGAGTVTCNFDGVDKNQTVVEEEVFLGSDTMLVAPVKVGARSATGAGAVVVDDVPPQTLVGGVPAKILRKL